MTVPNFTAPATTPLRPPAASALYLREDEIRRGIELLYFGYTAMLRGADAILEAEGLGRAHHRSLYFIARRPGLSVGDLLRLLNITKQSLGRVLTDLQGRGLVEQTVGTADRRQRLLRLTASGNALEQRLFAELESGMAAAYREAGQHAVSGFWAVLMGLVPAGDRPLVDGLQRTQP
jgi:DNA-binding MarR family transcriptional regulator